MKRNILKSISFVLTIIIALQISPCIFAHTTSQDGILAKTYIKEKDGWYIGGDDVGWRINEKMHCKSTTRISYSFSSSFTNSTYKQYVKDGAAAWKDIVTIATPTLFNPVEGEISTYIGTYENKDSDFVAKTHDRKVDGNGHLISWKISINLEKTEYLSAKIFAHEFGHVIGLTDLYEPKSSNKIMYAYSTMTVTAPTESDKNGANVILGFHENHYWGYTFYDTTSSGTSRHVKSCVICNGFCASSNGKDPIISNCTYSYKYYGTSGQGSNSHVKYCTGCNHYSTVSSCTYNSKGICTYCGIPKGYSPYSIDYEPE